MSTLRSTLLLTAWLSFTLTGCGGGDPAKTDGGDNASATQTAGDTAADAGAADTSTPTDQSTPDESTPDESTPDESTPDQPSAEAPPAEAPAAEVPPAEAPASDQQDPDAAEQDPPVAGDGSAEGDQPNEAETGQPETGQPETSEPDIAEPAPLGDAGLDTLVAFIREQQIDRSQFGWRERMPEPPLDDVTFEPGKTYFWSLQTSQGPLKFRFLPNIAPRHVANAAYLTLAGYYDNLDFHRVLKGFMAQGGCPKGDGTGDPGYSIDGEFSEFIKHDRAGLLSTANSGPGTDGSQIFVLFKEAPHLDGRHTIFGGLIEGRSTLRKMEKLAALGATIAPTEPIVIESATIEVAGGE